MKRGIEKLFSFELINEVRNLLRADYIYTHNYIKYSTVVYYNFQKTESTLAYKIKLKLWKYTMY